MVRFALICVYGVVAVYITEVGGDIARKIETTDNPHTGGDWRDRFTDDELEELGRMGVNVDGTYARYGGPTKEQRQAILAAQRLRGLRERFNSGRLSDDDKRELRKQFARSRSDDDVLLRDTPNVIWENEMRNAISTAYRHTKRVYVIGGSEIFAMALQYCRAYMITRVHCRVRDQVSVYDMRTFRLPASKTLVWRSGEQHEDDLSYHFELYIT